MSIRGIKAFIGRISRQNPQVDIYPVPFFFTAANNNGNITPDYHGAELYFSSPTPVTLNLNAPVSKAAYSSYANGNDPAAPIEVFDGWYVCYQNIGAATFTLNVGSTVIATIPPGTSGKIKSASGSYYCTQNGGSSGAAPGGASGDFQVNNGSGGFNGVSPTALLASLPVATAGAKGLCPAGTTGSANFLREDITFAAPPGGSGGSSLNSKVMSSTRDLTLTTVQDITGVGFTPKQVRITMSGGESSVRYSQGEFDGTNQSCTFHNVSAGGNGESDSFIIIVQDTAGTVYATAMASWITDGVRLTWARYGGISGTVTMELEFN